MPPTTVSPPVVDGGCLASRRLRAATRVEHLASEAALDLASLTGPPAVASLLRGWAAVWRSVGLAARRPTACTTAHVELIEPAEQAVAWLMDDLGELDAPAPRHTPVERAADDGCLDEPFVQLLAEPAASWGVAYVLRGSRLGGAVLAPLVSASAGLPPGKGTAFLRSAGTDPGREWVAFRRRMDSLVLTPGRVDVTVDAARRTFARVEADLLRHRRGGAGAEP